MKLRNPPRFGAIPLYRLIASVVAGEPVQPGDVPAAGHGKRDRLLSRYAGAQHRVMTIDQLKEHRREPTEDPTPEPQQPPAEPEGDSGRG